MTIKVGDKLPQATFRMMTADGPAARTTDDLFKGKTVVLFAVPGAFTPTCHKNHLPGFVAKADEIKAKGVDAIMVTAAAPHLPQPLVDQLKAGGRLVIPLGERGAQSLYVVEKDARGGVTQRKIIAVRFVPFTGDAVRRKP